MKKHLERLPACHPSRVRPATYFCANIARRPTQPSERGSTTVAPPLTPIKHPSSCLEAWCLFPALTICQRRVCRRVPFACTFVSPMQYAVVNMKHFLQLWGGEWVACHTLKLRHVNMSRRQYRMTSERSMWYCTVLHALSKMTVPRTLCFSRAAPRARMTATPTIAIRLCPQPSPIPGRASISAFTPTIRPTPRALHLNSACHAVSRPRYWRSPSP
jgi:hypothetical protein